MKIDQNKLILAAVIVILFGIFILSLTYIIPALGFLLALGIVGIVIYVIYLFLTGKIKI